MLHSRNIPHRFFPSFIPCVYCSWARKLWYNLVILCFFCVYMILSNCIVKKHDGFVLIIMEWPDKLSISLKLITNYFLIPIIKWKRLRKPWNCENCNAIFRNKLTYHCNDFKPCYLSPLPLTLLRISKVSLN